MKKLNNTIGWISAFFIVTAYFLLSIEIVEPDGFYYNILNLTGGIGLAYRVWVDKNYSNLFLEIIFISIAIKSLIIN